MKKLISLVLAMLMIFASFGATFTVFASTDVIDEDALSVSVKEAVALLSGLGLLDDSYDIMSTAPVTKSEFAKYVTRALGIDDINAEPAFSDTVGFDYVNIIADAGYISADKTKAYEPQKPIMLYDALDIALRAVGYGGVLDNYSDKIGRSVELARRVKLVDSIEANGMISCRTMVCIIFNMLFCDPGEQDIIVDNGHIVYDAGALIQNRWKTFKVKGKVTANEIFSIYIDHPKTDEGQLSIDNTVYKYSGNIASNELVGLDVIAFARENAQGKNEIFAIVVDENYTDFIEINAENIVEYRSKKLTYRTTNKTTKSVKIENPIVIYNGNIDYSSGNGKTERLINKIAEMRRGKIKLCSIKSQRTVLYLDIPEYMKVSRIDDMVVYGKAVGTGDLLSAAFDKTDAPLNNYSLPVDYSYAADVDGNLISVNDISVGDLLSVIISEDGSKVKIIKCTQTVNGSVEKLNTKNNDTIVVVDKTEYKLDRAYADTKVIRIGATGKFQIAENDRIAGTVGKVSYDGKQFGYIYALSSDGDFNKTVRAKIYNASGKDLTVTFKDKIKFDGSTIKDEVAYSNLLNSRGAFVKQGIIYKETDGILTEIDTINVGIGEVDSLGIMGAGGFEGLNRIRAGAPNGTYDVGVKLFRANTNDGDVAADAAGFPFSDDTTIIVLAVDDTGTVIPEYSKIDNNLSVGKYKVALYKSDSSSPFVDYITVLKGETDFGAMPKIATPILVDEIALNMNKNGDVVSGIIGIGYGASHPTYNNRLTAHEVTLYINGVKIKIQSSDLSKYLSKGDIIAVEKTDIDKDSCHAIRVIYDYSEGYVETGWKKLVSDDTNYIYTGHTELQTYDQYIAHMSRAEDASYENCYTYKLVNDRTKNHSITYGYVGDTYVRNSGQIMIKVDSLDSPDVNYGFITSRGTTKYPTFDENKTYMMDAYFAPFEDIVPSDVLVAPEKGDRVVFIKVSSMTEMYFFYKTYND